MPSVAVHNLCVRHRITQSYKCEARAMEPRSPAVAGRDREDRSIV